MIWGLDFGTRRVALACAETGFGTILRLKDSGKNAVPIEDAGRQMGQWLVDNLPYDPDPIFFAERPFVGRPHGNVRTAIGQALTVGGVLAQAPGEIHLIEQAAWKKAVIGRGNASKEDIAVWLRTWHPTLSSAAHGDQDLVDAFCISLFGGGLA